MMMEHYTDNNTLYNKIQNIDLEVFKDRKYFITDFIYIDQNNKIKKLTNTNIKEYYTYKKE